MKRFFAAFVGLFLVALAQTAWAQGVLISIRPDPVPLPRPIVRPRPVPPSTYKIKELSMSARIVDQVARVQVTQSFVNTGSRQMEVCFVFPLPYEGAIDALTLMVDGKEYAAKLLPAKEAREIYEGYIRRNQDPALLEWIGTGMFRTSVFPVPAGAERKVTLHFNQLLRKDHQVTDFLFPLGTAKYTSHAVEKVDLRVAIESSVPIKSVYSPTHDIDVARADDEHAVVTYSSKNEVPANDFRVFFDVAKGDLGASVLSYRPEADEDGYFLLLASPKIKAKGSERPPKTVVFVADRSGSMSGKKIEQAREALKFVLNNLREGDLFNIVAYDSTVEAFRPELQRYDEKTRKKALGFVEGLYAGGSTNIEGALTTALGMLKDKNQPSYVIFLTDGLPTTGETNEMKLVEMVRKANNVRARVINFGVGYDVNSRLLDRISRVAYGQSEYVRPDEDIEAHVSRLYDKITSPVMTDVAVRFDFDQVREEQGAPVNRMYPQQINDLFEGEQLVLVGRFKKHGRVKIAITGHVGEKQQKFDFAADLTKKSADQSMAFVEKLWAMRRIGQIIDELDLNGRNEELIKELVSLSTEHGILTPYTSFLADDTASIEELADTRSNRRQAGTELRLLDQAAGKAGFAQRAEKKFFQDAARPSAAAGEAFGAQNAAKFRRVDADEEMSAGGVQNVGRETLYKRGNVWFAANALGVDLSSEAANIKIVKRFTKEYFDLVRANTAGENELLSRQQADEQLVVRLRGQVYRIE